MGKELGKHFYILLLLPFQAKGVSDIEQTALSGKRERFQGEEPEKQDRRGALSGRVSAAMGEGNLSFQSLTMLKQTTD